MCINCQPNTTKICNVCNLQKQLTCHNYFWRNDTKKFRDNCKICHNINSYNKKQKLWLEDPNEYNKYQKNNRNNWHKYKNQRNLYRQELAKNEPIENKLINNAKKRAKKYNIEFNITIKDLPYIPNICPILQIPLIINPYMIDRENGLSLDRINSNLGYVKGNIQIISHKANRIKNNATLNELILIGKWAKNMVEADGFEPSRDTPVRS